MGTNKKNVLCRLLSAGLAVLSCFAYAPVYSGNCYVAAAEEGETEVTPDEPLNVVSWTCIYTEDGDSVQSDEGGILEVLDFKTKKPAEQIMDNDTLYIKVTELNGYKLRGISVSYRGKGGNLKIFSLDENCYSNMPTHGGYPFTVDHALSGCTVKVVATFILPEVVPPPHEHEWSEWMPNYDGTHTRYCLTDEDHGETEECVTGEIECEKSSVCEICGDYLAEAPGHDWDPEWRENEDGTYTKTCRRDPSHTMRRVLNETSKGLHRIDVCDTLGDYKINTPVAAEGEKVIITPIPEEGYYVSRVEHYYDIGEESFQETLEPDGEDEGLDSYSFVMNSGKGNYIFIDHEKKHFGIEVTTDGNGQANFHNDSAGMNYWIPNLKYGDKITLEARPAKGYRLKGWYSEQVTVGEDNTFIVPDLDFLGVNNEDNCIKIKAIFEWITEDEDGNVIGDANGDGVASVADMVALEKWLLGDSEVEITNVGGLDLCKDGVIDVYDLTMLRKYLTQMPHNVYAWRAVRGSGTVEVSKESAKPGEKITLTPIPNENYKFVSWDIVKGDVELDENNSFIMPAEEVSIVAIFEYDPQ